MPIQTTQIDLRILSELQKDSSLSYREIAQLVGTSTPSCLRRTKELKKKKILIGYHASVSSSLLNLDFIIYCDITLENHTHDDVVHFQNSMNTLSCVRECHMVTGKSDFLLKIIVSDINAYTAFLTKLLALTHNVSKVKSRMLVQTTKNEPGIPIEELITK